MPVTLLHSDTSFHTHTDDITSLKPVQVAPFVVAKAPYVLAHCILRFCK